MLKCLSNYLPQYQQLPSAKPPTWRFFCARHNPEHRIGAPGVLAQLSMVRDSVGLPPR